MRYRPKVNLYMIISEAVGRGIPYGLMRAYKHTNRPSKEQIIEEIDRAVMNELSEVLEFESHC